MEDIDLSPTYGGDWADLTDEGRKQVLRERMLLRVERTRAARGLPPKHGGGWKASVWRAWYRVKCIVLFRRHV